VKKLEILRQILLRLGSPEVNELEGVETRGVPKEDKLVVIVLQIVNYTGELIISSIVFSFNWHRASRRFSQ